MDTYKTASTLEGLFDLAKEDKLRIESLQHTPAYTNENEEYLITIRIARKETHEKKNTAEKESESSAAAAEKTAEQKQNTDSEHKEKTEEKPAAKISPAVFIIP